MPQSTQLIPYGSSKANDAILANMPKLTPKREAFATAYVLNGYNGTLAAQTAGYAADSAHVTSSRLLNDDKVKQAIERKLASTQVQIEYSTAEWLRDVLRLTRAAEQQEKYSPALKGYELVGRHIGALTNESKINREQAELFSYLGAQMAEYGRTRALGNTEPRQLGGSEVQEAGNLEAQEAEDTG